LARPVHQRATRLDAWSVERARTVIERLGEGPLRRALERLEREGSPLMQGAAGVVRMLLGQEASEAVRGAGGLVGGRGDRCAAR
jgi:hypothetical protein